MAADALPPALARAWAAACVELLTACRDELDRVNVFPVADADTGTNLLVTMTAAAAELDRADGAAAADGVSPHAGVLPDAIDLAATVEPGAPAAGRPCPLAALAAGAARGARGNSGIVLCQVLRGLADAPGSLTAGLAAGARHARAAFSRPVDGTALTVLDAAARHAADAAPPGDVADAAGVARAALAGATAELARTPARLPALADAGVVDAGGWGVVLVLHALVAVLDGTPLPVITAAPRPAAPTPDASRLDASRPDVPGPAGAPQRDAPGPAGTDMAGAAPRASPTGTDATATAPVHATPTNATPTHAAAAAPVYEVMYLLDGSTDERVAGLRAALDRVGDSVAVAGGPAAWTVHVHCADVGAAIEAGVEAGRPHRITVMPLMPPTPPAAAAPAAAGTPRRWARERAVVVVAPWPGFARLVRGEGAGVVVAAEGERDVLAAIVGTDAGHVVVLPNAGDSSGAAHRAARSARERGHDVVVVPTVSPVQVLAALAVHDGARRPADDVVTMAEAAAATRCGEVVIATHEALTWAGRCRPGDALGLADAEVVVITGSPVDAACDLADLMLTAGGELVTALVGAGAPPELAPALRARLRRSHPEVELAVYDGGQDVPLLVGVE